MQNLRNKKRLGKAALAFLLTFIVGGAFALSAGILDIQGTVRVASPDLLVVWGDGSGDAEAPLLDGDGLVEYSYEIVAGEDGRVRQRILWEVDFGVFADDGEGFAPFDPFFEWDDFDPPVFSNWAVLIAQAENIGAHDVIIEDVSVVPVWSGEAEGAELAEALGLTIDFVEDSNVGFVGQLDVDDATDPLVVAIVWEPDDMDEDLWAALAEEDGDYSYFRLYFEIVFDYVPAP